MFSKISWGQYILVLLIALVLYYSYVLLRYYGGDIRRLFSSHEPGNKVDEGDELSTLTDEKDFPAATELVQSVSAVIQQASHHHYVKEELIMALLKEVQRYPQLKGTAFQVAVNNQIEMDVSTRCHIKLEPEDLKRIWS